MLKDISQRIPVLLVESETLGDKESPEIPVIQADNYSMGRTLAEELLKEYDGNLEGKTIGIAVETEALEATRSRREGLWMAWRNLELMYAGRFQEHLDKEGKV